MRKYLSILVSTLFGLAASKSSAQDLIVVGQVFGDNITFDREEFNSREHFEKYDPNSTYSREQHFKRLQISEIHDLLTYPLIQKFRQAHATALQVSELEYRRYAGWLEQQRKSQSKDDLNAQNEKFLQERTYLEPKIARVKEAHLKRPSHDMKARKRNEQTIFLAELSMESYELSEAVLLVRDYKEQSLIYRLSGGGRMTERYGRMKAIDALRRQTENEEKENNLVITPEYRKDFYSYYQLTSIPENAAEAEEYFLNPPWSEKPLEMLSEKVPVNQ